MANIHKFQQPIRVGRFLADPAGEAGAIYYNTDDNVFKIRDGVSYKTVADRSFLSSTSTGEGASQIGIEDVGSLFTATNVESALAEVKGVADNALSDAADAQADATQALADAAAAQGDIDAHLDGNASKHDASEVDYERADLSKKNIDAASDDVETALNDLDDSIGSLAASPSNYTPVDATIVASHLAAIDSALATAGAVDFADDEFRISDDLDSTKKIAFQASGIATSTVRTITMPNEDVDLGDMAKSSELSSNSTGLGASLIGIEDAGNKYTATTVEGALDDVMDAAVAAQDSADDAQADATQALADAAAAQGTANAAQVDATQALADAAAAQSDATQALADAAAAQSDATQALADAAAAQADIDAHLDGNASKHDATEVDYERIDASKIDIQATSDDVELALNDLDDNKISKTGSVEFTGEQSMGNFKITNLADPDDAQDAATKLYVDNVATGLDPKASAVAATTAALPASTYNNGASGVGATLTADVDGAFPLIDGVTVAISQRVLVKNQVAQLQNGIYNLTQVGSPSLPWILTRATDFDGSPSNEVDGGEIVFIREGTTNGATSWIVIAPTSPVVMGTDSIVFTQASTSIQYTEGDGIDIVGNAISVDIDDLTGDGIENDGSNNFRIASSAAGDGLTGGSGSALSIAHDGEGLTFVTNELALELDGSTLSKSEDGLKVADLGISDGQVANDAAISLSKLATLTGDLALVSSPTGVISVSSVSTTELGYVSGVTSGIQGQLDDKLENVVEDTTPQLGGDLDLNSKAFLGSMRLADIGSESRFFEWDYIDVVTLTASTTAVASAFTFDSRNIKGREIEYTIVDGNSRRIGTLRVAGNNAATVASNDLSFVDEMNEVGDVGVTWNAAVNGNNIEFSYTTTAGAGNRTMRVVVKSILA